MPPCVSVWLSVIVSVFVQVCDCVNAYVCVRVGVCV